MRKPSPILSVLPLLLALAGCGGGDDAAGRDDHAYAGATEAGDADAQAPNPDDGFDDLPPPVELEAGHLDALARGMAAENQHLEQVLQRLQAAQDDAEKMAALAGTEPPQLDAVGAEAAGFEVEEDYRRLRDALHGHLDAIETRRLLEAEYAQVDTAGMDAATAAEAERHIAEIRAVLPDPYADLAPTLADALRQRQAELAALRMTHVTLLFQAAEL